MEKIKTNIQNSKQPNLLMIISEKRFKAFEIGCTERADFPDRIFDFRSLCAFSGWESAVDCRRYLRFPCFFDF